MEKKGQLVASFGPFDLYLGQARNHPERSEFAYTIWLNTKQDDILIHHLPLYQSPLPDILHALYEQIAEVQKLRRAFNNSYEQLQDPEIIKSDIAKGYILPGASIEKIQKSTLQHIRDFNYFEDELVAGIHTLKEAYPQVSAQDALIYKHGFPHPPSYEKLMQQMRGRSPQTHYSIGALAQVYDDFGLHDVSLVQADGSIQPTVYYAIILHIEDDSIGVGALGKAEGDFQGTVQQIKLCLLDFFPNKVRRR